MGPSDLQELIDFEPFVPFRMKLSSGDVIEVRQADGVSVGGLTMTISYPPLNGDPRFRLISLPNIAFVEPIADRSHGGRLSGEDQ